MKVRYVLTCLSYDIFIKVGNNKNGRQGRACEHVTKLVGWSFAWSGVSPNPTFEFPLQKYPPSKFIWTENAVLGKPKAYFHHYHNISIKILNSNINNKLHFPHIYIYIFHAWDSHSQVFKQHKSNNHNNIIHHNIASH